jgi:hypothetical protein
VSIFVDYESPLARRVAGGIWSGLSMVALDAGYTKTTAFWESLRAPRKEEKLEGVGLRIYAVGQERPDAVDAIRPVGDGLRGSCLYGVVVAVPNRSSPLVGSLLYQGVERLTGCGVKAGTVELALLHAFPKEERESYARRLLERFHRGA